MKLTIDRAALLRSLGHAQSVVEKRNTIPILANVRLEAANSRLNLTATDLDIELTESVDCSVIQPGGTTVPAHTLYDIVRKLPDGAEIEFVHVEGEGRLRLRAGSSSFSLASLPRDDFPVMSEGELPVVFTIPGLELVRLIDKTKFAVSTEETRYYLNGIYLHAVPNSAEGGQLRAVATDGHRLARVDTALPEGAGVMPGVIIPRKAVNEIRRLIDGVEAEVKLCLSETKIRLVVDSMVLTSKLIDGTFPEYERVIPSGNDKHLSVDPKVFSEAVDRVSTISTDKSRAVKLSMSPQGVTVSAASPDQGSASEEIPVGYDSAAMEIGFNSRYLLDIAQQIQGELATLSLNDATSPTIIRDSGDKGALFVLMPMRV